MVVLYIHLLLSPPTPLSCASFNPSEFEGGRIGIGGVCIEMSRFGGQD